MTELCVKVYLAYHAPSEFQAYLPKDPSVFWVAYVPDIFKGVRISFLESTSFTQDAVAEVIEVPGGQLFLGRNPL